MSNPSNPSWTGACLQGNLRLLSPRLFAMGRGWRRGPSSHGQSATATRSTGHTYRWLGSYGVLLQTSDPGSWFGVMVSVKITHNPDNFSGEALLQHFCKGAAILGWTQNALLERRGCHETSPSYSCHTPKYKHTNWLYFKSKHISYLFIFLCR